MKLLCECQEYQALESVNRLVHDFWFDLQELKFENEIGRITIPLCDTEMESLFKKKTRHRHLIVDQVSSVNHEDSQGIGKYDITELRYDADDRILKIVTGIPMVFTVSVDELSLKVYEV